MAAYGFKGLGWFIMGAVVGPACYLVTSHVAAERSRLAAVESAIVKAHQDIRGLETEFDTRANMVQLQRWNGDFLALTAPRPEQFAAETSLASLNLPVGGTETAQLLVPSGANPIAPQPAVATTVVPAAVQVSAPAPVPAEPAARPARPVGPVATAQNNTVARGRNQAMAMLDDKLLSRTTIADLQERARSELMTLR